MLSFISNYDFIGSPGPGDYVLVKNEKMHFEVCDIKMLHSYHVSTWTSLSSHSTDSSCYVGNSLFLTPLDYISSVETVKHLSADRGLYTKWLIAAM